MQRYIKTSLAPKQSKTSWNLRRTLRRICLPMLKLKRFPLVWQADAVAADQANAEAGQLHPEITLMRKRIEALFSECKRMVSMAHSKSIVSPLRTLSCRRSRHCARHMVSSSSNRSVPISSSMQADLFLRHSKNLRKSTALNFQIADFCILCLALIVAFFFELVCCCPALRRHPKSWNYPICNTGQFLSKWINSSTHRTLMTNSEVLLQSARSRFEDANIFQTAKNIEWFLKSSLDTQFTCRHSQSHHQGLLQPS